MSQVGILSPQGLQSSATDSQNFPLSDTFYAMDTSEPSVGEIANDKGKHFCTSDSRSESTMVDPNVGNNSDALNGSSNSNQHSNSNKKGKQRYRWKPYHKLNWEERILRGERETRRAEKSRARRNSYGVPLAPYNTTQFLMDDHNLQEPDYDRISGKSHHQSTSDDSSEDSYYSSPEDEEDFLKQQFAETYKNLHAERLDSMSKAELIQELMTIEDKVEDIEKQLEQSPTKTREETPATLEEQLEKIRVFKDEILKLSNDNMKLRWENEELRQTVYETVVK